MGTFCPSCIPSWSGASWKRTDGKGRADLELIRKFLRLPLRQKLLIPQIFVLMEYYRFRVHHRPFAELSPKIGTLRLETPLVKTPRNAWLVHEMMNAMFRRIRWKDSCLIRALTAKKLLNRMGEKCTLYMGVRKLDGEPMTAHAWLRCGRLIVTGGESRSGFTVTAVYGDAESV